MGSGIRVDKFHDSESGGGDPRDPIRQGDPGHVACTTYGAQLAGLASWHLPYARRRPSRRRHHQGKPVISERSPGRRLHWTTAVQPGQLLTRGRIPHPRRFVLAGARQQHPPVRRHGGMQSPYRAAPVPPQDPLGFLGNREPDSVQGLQPPSRHPRSRRPVPSRGTARSGRRLGDPQGMNKQLAVLTAGREVHPVGFARPRAGRREAHGVHLARMLDPRQLAPGHRIPDLRRARGAHGQQQSAAGGDPPSAGQHRGLAGIEGGDNAGGPAIPDLHRSPVARDREEQPVIVGPSPIHRPDRTVIHGDGVQNLLVQWPIDNDLARVQPHGEQQAVILGRQGRRIGIAGLWIQFGQLVCAERVPEDGPGSPGLGANGHRGQHAVTERHEVEAVDSPWLR